MLYVDIPTSEMFNEDTQEFVFVKGQKIQLEHSLVSLSKWESKWNKPFLSTKEKTNEEIMDYIKCMTITQNVSDDVYKNMQIDTIQKIFEYVNLPMTATTINNKNGKNSREIITSEIIYYWMIELQIPFECQKWHLNRLLTLIQVCNAKQSPGKKMNPRDVIRNNAALNNARRKKYGTRG